MPNPGEESPTVDAPLLDKEGMADFIRQSMKYGDMWKYSALANKHGAEITGGVTRKNSRYAHENTVSFELTTDDWEDPDTGEQFFPGKMESRIEADIQSAVVDISRKIYSELEQEHDYQFYGEGAEDSMRANEYEFDEYGERVDGTGIHYDDLGDSEKETAKEWWARANEGDSYWHEGVLDIWKERLQEMGFTDPDISFSGFGSQGDGASFTSGFEFDDYLQYLASGKGEDLGL